MFDKWFDALNVCNFTDGRKPFKSPYRSCTDGEDFCLKVYLFYLLRLYITTYILPKFYIYYSGLSQHIWVI